MEAKVIAMDRYRLLSQIGKGTGGVVFLANHLSSGEFKAIKQVELDDRRKTRTKEAVEREARILASLSHPHIVHFDEYFFHEPNLLCIVQEYCDGGTLADQIATAAESESLIPETLIWKWFIQVLLALHYLHNSQRVIHRDLKAANVFLVKSKTVKIGDFGIAKTLAADDVAVTCVGTPCYLSPELVQDVPYSTQSDMWSLGCLLYELVALRRAFDAQNLLSLFAKISRADFAPFDVDRRYSSSLHEIVDALLRPDPVERPTAQRLLRDPVVAERLDAFIDEKEILKTQRELTRSGGGKNDSPPKLSSSLVETLENFENVDRGGADLLVVGSKVVNAESWQKLERGYDEDFEEESEEEVEYGDDYEEDEEEEKDEEYEDDFDDYDSTDEEVLENAKSVRDIVRLDEAGRSIPGGDSDIPYKLPRVTSSARPETEEEKIFLGYLEETCFLTLVEDS